MRDFFTFRRLALVGLVFCVAIAAVAVAVRARLVALALDRTLATHGASEISFVVDRATPWTVVVADLGFKLAAQTFGAKRITLAREHWWTPSLGAVRVEGVRVPVNLDRLVAAKPAADEKTAIAPSMAAMVSRVPLQAVSFDGQLVVQAGGLPDQTLTVKFAARRDQPDIWTAETELAGPGLAATATARFDVGQDDLTFKVSGLRLEAKSLQAWAERITPLPAGPWEFAGTITGELTGGFRQGKFTAAGVAHLRDGRVGYPSAAIVAEGVEADLEFADAGRLITKPGQLRIRELQTPKVSFTDLRAEVALTGPERISVTQFSAKTLDGSISTEPFDYVPASEVLAAVVMVDGISAEKVMALTQNLPARASGKLSGRLPVHFDAKGLRFGTGWLGVQPGSTAELQLNAAGLLTSGASPKSPSYAVLQKVESGLLKLNVTELRLDIRPPNSPEGRTAQLHVAGQPVDPTVKVPVVLDLNVNGPVEALLNLGMKSGLSIGTKP
jgi:hypothetical protein